MNPSRLGLILPREMKICLLADPWNSFQFTVLSYQGKKMKMKKKIGKERKEIKIAKLVRCRFHFPEYRETYEMNSYNREYVLMKREN